MNEKKQALGFIESVGLASAIAAADAALKAANVSLIGRENSKGYGYITIKIAGQVEAVKAAIDAAKAVSSRVQRVWSVDVIPRPAAGLGDALVWNSETMGAAEWLASFGGGEQPTPAEQPAQPEPAAPTLDAPAMEGETCPGPAPQELKTPPAPKKPAPPKPGGARSRKKK